MSFLWISSKIIAYDKFSENYNNSFLKLFQIFSYFFQNSIKFYKVCFYFS